MNESLYEEKSDIIERISRIYHILERERKQENGLEKKFGEKSSVNKNKMINNHKAQVNQALRCYSTIPSHVHDADKIAIKKIVNYRFEKQKKSQSSQRRKASIPSKVSSRLFCEDSNPKNPSSGKVSLSKKPRKLHKTERPNKKVAKDLSEKKLKKQEHVVELLKEKRYLDQWKLRSSVVNLEQSIKSEANENEKNENKNVIFVKEFHDNVTDVQSLKSNTENNKTIQKREKEILVQNKDKPLEQETKQTVTDELHRYNKPYDDKIQDLLRWAASDDDISVQITDDVENDSVISDADHLIDFMHKHTDNTVEDSISSLDSESNIIKSKPDPKNPNPKLLLINPLGDEEDISKIVTNIDNLHLNPVEYLMKSEEIIRKYELDDYDEPFPKYCSSSRGRINSSNDSEIENLPDLVKQNSASSLSSPAEYFLDENNEPPKANIKNPRKRMSLSPNTSSLDVSQDSPSRYLLKESSSIDSNTYNITSRTIESFDPKKFLLSEEINTTSTFPSQSSPSKYLLGSSKTIDNSANYSGDIREKNYIDAETEPISDTDIAHDIDQKTILNTSHFNKVADCLLEHDANLLQQLDRLQKLNYSSDYSQSEKDDTLFISRNISEIPTNSGNSILEQLDNFSVSSSGGWG